MSEAGGRLDPRDFNIIVCLKNVHGAGGLRLRIEEKKYVLLVIKRRAL